MPNGPLRITGLPFAPADYESEKKIEDEEILVSTSSALFNLKSGLCVALTKFKISLKLCVQNHSMSEHEFIKSPPKKARPWVKF